jgi:predicted kinase
VGAAVPRTGTGSTAGVRDERHDGKAPGPQADGGNRTGGARQAAEAAGQDAPPSVLRPHAFHDLRAAPATGPAAAPAALHYGPADLLVVAGLPGAGKSTLMERCAQRGLLIDSQHVRDAYQARLPRFVPYALFRPLVRFTHYGRLAAALRAGGPLVVHDCGTVPFVRAWLKRTARRQGRGIHLLVLDVDPAIARAGQRARRRTVSPREFTRHRRVTSRALAALSSAAAPPRGWHSAVLVDRPAAGALHEIRFTADDRHRAGRPEPARRA